MKRDPLVRMAMGYLRSHRFPGADTDRLAAVLARGETRELPDGAELCREGEPGDSLFFLVEGAVAVDWHDARGTPYRLASLQAPAIVGHWALVDDALRVATCTAVGGIVAVVLGRAAYGELRRDPTADGATFRRLLLSSLSDQLTKANAQILAVLSENPAMCSKEALERIARQTGP